VNIAIVGAGIVGHAVAYELASRGARVRLLDPRADGGGATQASAGILAPHIEGHLPPLLRLGVCSLEHFDSFIARLRADAGRAVEYRRTGTLQVARDEVEARVLEETARSLAAAHVDHRLLGGGEARELEPQLATTATAALLVPQHGYVGVRTLMSALAEATMRRGGTRLTVAARAIERRDGRIRIETSEGTVDADAVVLAAGSWSGEVAITPVPPVPVRPIRGQLLHLRLDAAPFSRVVWGSGSYLVPWEDGSLLVGATVEDAGFDERATVEGVLQLLAGAAELAPVVRRARFDEVRVGLRPATADELPVIGASSTMRGVYYATGHYRNGVLLAPLTAVMLADLLLGGRERSEMALVRPDRFGL
jgi:glycine oxidase